MLGLVALPGELIPLHIFEERYKTMMNDCLTNEHEFGIVWLSDDGLRTVGCAARIERVLERMDDGRMNLLVRPTVVERQAHLAYPAGVIEFVWTMAMRSTPRSRRHARDAYSELVKRATDHEPHTGTEITAMDAYSMAATVDFGLEAKQGRSTCAPRTPSAARHALVQGSPETPRLRRPRARSGQLKRKSSFRLTKPSRCRCEDRLRVVDDHRQPEHDEYTNGFRLREDRDHNR